MAAIFYFRHNRTSDSILTSLFVLPDLENMGIAVEISLLSCLEAEIYVSFYALPVMAAIFDFRHTQTRTVFPSVSPCCPTPKTWV